MTILRGCFPSPLSTFNLHRLSASYYPPPPLHNSCSHYLLNLSLFIFSLHDSPLFTPPPSSLCYLPGTTFDMQVRYGVRDTGSVSSVRILWRCALCSLCSQCRQSVHQTLNEQHNCISTQQCDGE